MDNGVELEQFICINFEDMRFSHLLAAETLHNEIIADNIVGKIYLFFDKIQEVKDWEKCVNSLRVALDCDIYITGSNVNLLSGEPAKYLGGRYVEFIIYPFPLRSLWSYTTQSFRIHLWNNAFKNICCVAVCHISLIYIMRQDRPDNIWPIFSTLFNSNTLSKGTRCET